METEEEKKNRYEAFLAQQSNFVETAQEQLGDAIELLNEIKKMAS